MTNSWQTCHQGFFFSIYTLHIQSTPLWTSSPPFFFHACLLSPCPSTTALQECKLFYHVPVIPAMSQLCDCTDFLFLLVTLLHICLSKRTSADPSHTDFLQRDVPPSFSCVCSLQLPDTHKLWSPPWEQQDMWFHTKQTEFKLFTRLATLSAKTIFIRCILSFPSRPHSSKSVLLPYRKTKPCPWHQQHTRDGFRQGTNKYDGQAGTFIPLKKEVPDYCYLSLPLHLHAFNSMIRCIPQTNSLPFLLSGLYRSLSKHLQLEKKKNPKLTFSSMGILALPRLNIASGLPLLPRNGGFGFLLLQ